jgi:hypothetical protein
MRGGGRLAADRGGGGRAWRMIGPPIIKTPSKSGAYSYFLLKNCVKKLQLFDENF